jgi:phosphatidate cytidylyltransferase
LAAERAAPGGRSELRTRVLSAAVLAPVALAAMVLGGFFFAAFVAAVAAIGLWEWVSISRASEPPALAAGAAAILVAGLLGVWFVENAWPALVIVGAAALALLAGVRGRTSRWIGFGLLYAGIPAVALMLLRAADPHGWLAVLYILLIVWATDTGAFFGGRAIGGPKLWPRVSPKKTWSGAIAGLATAMVVGLLTAWLSGVGGLMGAMLLALPLSIAAQGGDLLESGVKRHFGVKDSGHIIPGHGGVLDRIDGLLAAAALAWLIAALGLGGEILVLPRTAAGAAA